MSPAVSKPLTLREAWPAIVWLRRWAALVGVGVADMVETVLWPLPGHWSCVPLGLVEAGLIGTCAMAIHTNAKLREQRDAQEAATHQAEAEAALLRQLSAPDAGPGQCPACGLEELDELASDDELMERGPDRCKVVPYGRRRAHRECAEFVPYRHSPQELAEQRHAQHAAAGICEMTCPLCLLPLLGCDLPHRPRPRNPVHACDCGCNAPPGSAPGS